MPILKCVSITYQRIFNKSKNNRHMCNFFSMKGNKTLLMKEEIFKIPVFC